MSLEAKAGSALPVARLGLGLGKGYAYAASGALVGTLLGAALMVTAGTLILAWFTRSAKKTEQPKTEN